MYDLSDFLAQELLDHIFRGNDAPSIPTVYVSAHTADPGENGANAETVGGGYGRQASSWGAPYLDAGNSDTPTVDLAATLTFLDMPAQSTTHLGLWTADSGGDYLGRIVLDAPVVTTAGQAATFAAGALHFTLD